MPTKLAAPPTPKDPLVLVRKYSSLTLFDLIEARDQYHLHLTRKKGVVATAVGKYFIRNRDSRPGQPPKRDQRGPKRPDNSGIRNYSWPCVLVFVEKWVDHNKLPHGYTYADMIPPAIYMPDGRVVPVCVVEAPMTGNPLDPQRVPAFPRQYLSGGFPVIAIVQGEEHLGTVGCLVTDGHATYALTSRHVAGEPGTPIYSLMGEKRREVGVAAGPSIRKRPFKDVYRGWPGENLMANLDVGLIKLHDRDQWLPRVFGIGPLGPIVDLGMDAIGLQLVGQLVRAYGSVSGPQLGQVQGLFYRYASIAGTEYCADFLIGPRGEGTLESRRGDSGTLWAIDIAPAHPGGEVPPPRPFAIQWGGQVFEDAEGKARRSFALATNLSVTCRELEIDLVRDKGEPLPEYWGTFGHFTIANLACEHVGSANSALRKLMKANLTNITFDRKELEKNEFSGFTKKKFVPLADVPDLAWKMGLSQRGPRKTNREGPNHFADMDEKPSGGGSTLLELCKDPANIDPDVWIAHLNRFPKVDWSHAGLLPFRVWQIFDEMVTFVRKGEAASFVCAAGVLAHYIGDSTQPLHCSYLHHGDPKDTETHTVHHKKTGTTSEQTKNRADAVHAEYEEDMFRGREIEMRTAVEAAIRKAKEPKAVKSGREAGQLTVALMQESFRSVPPVNLVAFYTQLVNADTKKSDRLSQLWDEYGTATARCFSSAALALADLWESAWSLGGGNQTIGNAGTIDRDDLIKLYGRKTFLESYYLKEIGPHLQGRAVAKKVAKGKAAKKAVAKKKAVKR